MVYNAEDSIVGCLLGTAAGDALGLPMEGISRKRQQKMFRDLDRYHLLFGKGMVSDDTEHTAMVAQSLIKSSGRPEDFAKDLAWRLRFWMLNLPAGIGFATLRAILKLWLGFPPDKSGVFSAGNGPAMRSAIIGAAYAGRRDEIKNLVRANTILTHTDPKAEFGALAVALAASQSAMGKGSPTDFLELYEKTVPEDRELINLLEKAAASAEKGESTRDFAASLGLHKGVTGYIYHTAPAAIHAWLKNPEDLQTALIEIIRCGGDTDTTAAIVGGIVGSRVGPRGVSAQLIENLWEWPRSVSWLESLGRTLAEAVRSGKMLKPPSLPPGGAFLRNILFIGIVLAHGFRRIFPPY